MAHACRPAPLRFWNELADSLEMLRHARPFGAVVLAMKGDNEAGWLRSKAAVVFATHATAISRVGESEGGR